MTPTTTAQKLARLERLRNEAGKSIYERIKLACEVRDDERWVQTIGDVDKAEAHLQEEFLADLCYGTVTFGEAYRIFQAVPDFADWNAHKFNLPRLHALMRERTPQPAKQQTDDRRRVTLKDLEEATERLKDAEYTAKRAREEAEFERKENEMLRAKVARLEGRIEELERQLNMRRAI